MYNKGPKMYKIHKLSTALWHKSLDEGLGNAGLSVAKWWGKIISLWIPATASEVGACELVCRAPSMVGRVSVGQRTPCTCFDGRCKEDTHRPELNNWSSTASPTQRRQSVATHLAIVSMAHECADKKCDSSLQDPQTGQAATARLLQVTHNCIPLHFGV